MNEAKNSMSLQYPERINIKTRSNNLVFSPKSNYHNLSTLR
jgi:hypothetical protein